jgi:hypothetical protein
LRDNSILLSKKEEAGDAIIILHCVSGRKNDKR